MISVLKTCISVMKTTTDFSVVSKAIVLKLGTLLDNMSGYARAKFHGPHYNSARVNSLQILKNPPIFSVSLENGTRYPFEINVIIFRFSVQNSLEKTRPLNVQEQPQKICIVHYGNSE